MACINYEVVYEKIKDKLKDRYEIKYEEFEELIKDIKILKDQPLRYTLATDAMYSFGWAGDDREEDGRMKHYLVKRYDITPEMYAKVIRDFYESHRIHREDEK